MRYPRGDGLTATVPLREELRLRAAGRFARGGGSTAMARVLRVSVRSVQRWRHAWAEGGPRAHVTTWSPRGRTPVARVRGSSRSSTTSRVQPQQLIVSEPTLLS
ncbi:helix-turn-helix domain-containing protein [Streptomyces sp. NPDC014734]|uniref:helix-turn-helix domain-containing protein n=1 Tax=Streptomyces sp. NPDC014734 TaxID=3364886 RepID=UPI0036FFE367